MLIGGFFKSGGHGRRAFDRTAAARHVAADVVTPAHAAMPTRIPLSLSRAPEWRDFARRDF